MFGWWILKIIGATIRWLFLGGKTKFNKLIDRQYNSSFKDWSNATVSEIIGLLFMITIFVVLEILL